MTPETPILVLGAPRTGTSCVAGVLAAAGARVPGPMVRNWDNARGHFEATAAVRLSDRVLSLSGGSWMQAPPHVRWDAEAERERERLLQPVDGRPALLKDPRLLLCWPFWAGTAEPVAVVGTVRHPLAAARSMSAWRRIDPTDGQRLWLAHCRVLLELARGGVPLIDVDAEPEALRASMLALIGRLPETLDAEAGLAHYDPRELHHHGDHAEALPEALAVHRKLLALMPPVQRRRSGAFPWDGLSAVRDLLARGEAAAALERSRTLLAEATDPVAVLLPLAADLLRSGAYRAVLELVERVAPPPPIAGLLRGKALLAAGEPRAAVEALTAATAGPQPYWEARSLLAQALYAARRRAEARSLLIALAPEAVHPASCLSTAAEWAWRDGDHVEALRLFAAAVDASPPHRRGRLRCRRAELLAATGHHQDSLAELTTACAEDPTYPRSRDLLLAAGGKLPILPPHAGNRLDGDGTPE